MKLPFNHKNLELSTEGKTIDIHVCYYKPYQFTNLNY